MCQPKQSAISLRSAAVVAALPVLPRAEHVLSVLVEVVIAAALAAAAAGVAYLCHVLRRDRAPVVSRAEASALAAEARRQLSGTGAPGAGRAAVRARLAVLRDERAPAGSAGQHASRLERG